NAEVSIRVDVLSVRPDLIREHPLRIQAKSGLENRFTRVLRSPLLRLLWRGATLAAPALTGGRCGFGQRWRKSSIGEAVDEPGLNRQAHRVDYCGLRWNRNVRAHCVNETIPDHNGALRDHRSGNGKDSCIFDRINGPRGWYSPSRHDRDQQKSVSDAKLGHNMLLESDPNCRGSL